MTNRQYNGGTINGVIRMLNLIRRIFRPAPPSRLIPIDGMLAHTDRMIDLYHSNRSN